jgi:hypothetical protein
MVDYCVSKGIKVSSVTQCAAWGCTARLPACDEFLAVRCGCVVDVRCHRLWQEGRNAGRAHRPSTVSVVGMMLSGVMVSWP